VWQNRYLCILLLLSAIFSLFASKLWLDELIKYHTSSVDLMEINLAFRDLSRSLISLDFSFHSQFMSQGNFVRYIFFPLNFLVSIYLFLPVYMLFPSYKTLIVLKHLFLFAPPPLLYLLARKKLKSHLLAFVVALSYLLFPLTIANVFQAWDPGYYLALPLIVALVYLWESDNFRLFVIVSILLPLCKQDLALLTILFGFFFLLKGDKSLFGFIPILTGSITLSIYLGYFLIFPESSEIIYRSNFGVSPSSLISNLLRPQFWLERIVNSFTYLKQLATSTLLIPSFAPGLLLPSLPALAIATLEHDPVSNSHVVILVFVALIYALKNLKNILNAIIGHKLAIRTLMVLAGLMMLSSLFQSQAYFANNLPTYREGFPSFNYACCPNSTEESFKDRYTAFRNLMRRIPPNATVTADKSIALPLTDRRRFYSPANQYRADYALFNEKLLDCVHQFELERGRTPLRFCQHLRPQEFFEIEEFKRRNFEVLNRTHGFLLLRRR